MNGGWWYREYTENFWQHKWGLKRQTMVGSSARKHAWGVLTQENDKDLCFFCVSYFTCYKVVPPSYVCWFTIPMNTIDITPINPSEIRLICTKLAIPNWGTTARNVWVVQWFHVVRCTRCVQPGVFLQMG